MKGSDEKSGKKEKGIAEEKEEGGGKKKGKGGKSGKKKSKEIESDGLSVGDEDVRTNGCECVYVCTCVGEREREKMGVVWKSVILFIVSLLSVVLLMHFSYLCVCVCVCVYVCLCAEQVDSVQRNARRFISECLASRSHCQEESLETQKDKRSKQN